MSQTKPRKLTGSDAGNIRSMMGGPGWQLIRERIEKTLTGKREELEQPCDPVKTSELRGVIAGLKLALSIPEILISEAKGNPE